MATEIERKFLVKADALPGLLDSAGEGKRLVQGYIETVGHTAVRVRLAGDAAFLTIKGPSDAAGMTRAEFEYAIPPEDADAMLGSLCGKSQVEKVRYKLPIEHHVWEIDVFSGANTGLVLAEVELQDAAETVNLPEWVGAEVTGQVRYYNSELSRTPYSRWADGDLADE